MTETLIGWTKKRGNIAVIFLAAILLILHLVTITKVKTFISDEEYYVVQAEAIVYGIDEAYEEYSDFFESTGYDSLEEPVDLEYRQHPPLGRLLIAAGIRIFGDNSFGWRIFPVLFGVASIILFYLICQSLTFSKWLPIIATFFFAFENMNFIMSNLAMLDVFSVTFMLGSFLFYLKGRYSNSGILLALAALTKLPALAGGIIILIHWLLTRKTKKRDYALFIGVAIATFFIMMPPLDYIAMDKLYYPWDRLDFMVNVHLNEDMAKFSSNTGYEALSRPWDWILANDNFFFHRNPDYQVSLSWTIWIMIIPSMCYMGYKSVRKNFNAICLFALLWFACVYFSWISIYLLWDRIMYSFYFYPAIGAICLASGYIIDSLIQDIYINSNTTGLLHTNKPLKIGMTLFIGASITAHLIIFFIMAPII